MRVTARSARSRDAAFDGVAVDVAAAPRRWPRGARRAHGPAASAAEPATSGLRGCPGCGRLAGAGDGRDRARLRGVSLRDATRVRSRCAQDQEGRGRQRHLFGTDGIRGVANEPPMTPELALQLGPRRDLRGGPRQAPRAAHRDRQGHAAVGLHARDRARLGHLLDGRPSDAVRPDADAGRRASHPQHARRRRHRDQRQPQPVRRQRHQDLRRRRLQAPRRGRGRDRGADRTTTRSPAAQDGPRRSAAPRSSRTRAAATWSFAKATFPRDLSLDGVRVVVDAAHGAAYRVAPAGASRSWAPSVTAIGVRPNGTNINRDCGRAASRERRARR